MSKGNRFAFTEPPKESADFREWNEWKETNLTNSQNEFCQRNQWFTFSKEEIYNKLLETARIPKVLFHNRNSDFVEVSKVFEQIRFPRDNWRVIVVKELRGHSSKQVALLTHISEGLFWDAISKTNKTIDELDEWLKQTRFLVEEPLTTYVEPIPVDFKIYTMRGKAKICVIVNRNSAKPRLTFVDLQNMKVLPWKEVFYYPGPSVWLEGDTADCDIINRARLAVKEAERLAAFVNASDLFVSFDMFVVMRGGERQTLLGEITPRPGAFHANKTTTSFIRRVLLS